MATAVAAIARLGADSTPLAYIDFRAELIRGDLPNFTCLLGTLVQETFYTHPRLRDVCGQGIAAHALTVARDIAAAKASCAPEAKWDPETLAYYIQAVIQGAFVLAKAQGDSRVAVLCIHQLRNHLEMLLPPQPPTRPKRRARP